MLTKGTVLCGRYKIEQQIGQGGMSAVYLARDLHLGRRCAVKEVRKIGGPNEALITRSLVTEVEMLKRLSHPNLPQIYDVFEAADTFTMVMEYIDGVSMDRFLAQYGPQSVEDVVKWGQIICDVFAYLHNQNPPIIYRDMKPANLMLLADGNIKVIDFGTARTQKMEAKQDTILFGTSGFAAPEQYGDQGQSTARTDIYGLGATMYNLVTGKMPHNHLADFLDDEEALRDSPLREILKKCLRDDANERYQSAAELQQALAGVGKSGNRHNTGWLRTKRLVEPAGQGWQVSNLSGILKGTANLAAAKKPPEIPAGWQKAQEQEKPVEGMVHIPEATNQRPPVQNLKNVEAYEEPQSSESGLDESTWRALLMVSAVAVVIFAILAIVSAVMNQGFMAGISMCLAVLGATAGCYCGWKVWKPKN